MCFLCVVGHSKRYETKLAPTADSNSRFRKGGIRTAGLAEDQLITLLRQCKKLEEETVALVGVEDNPCRDMLANRLGLNWGANGGSGEVM